MAVVKNYLKYSAFFDIIFNMFFNMFFNMTSLSITLPDNIAQASNETAKKLGITRTEFIRQAVVHELKNVQSKLEQKEVIDCFNNMKLSRVYLEDAEQTIEELDINISEEKDEWWSNK